MKKTTFFGLLLWTLLATSCQKQVNVSFQPDLPGNGLSKPPVSKPSYLPIGGADGSGVDQRTGYTLLSQHYMTDANGVRLQDPNGNWIWDGTYDAPYYDVTLNITICRYKLSPRLGDPAFGYFSTPPGTGTNVTSDCVSAFTLEMIKMIITPYYTPSTFSDFQLNLTNYFNGTTNTYPVPGSSIGGAAILTRYGKLITISPGVYAVAEMAWAPPVPQCNALCQLCLLNPNDPSCP